MDVEGSGVIQARADGLAGKEGKYVAWRSLRKEGDEGSRDGGAGKAGLSLGRGGGIEAGCRSGGVSAGGRSEAASRDRSAVEDDDEFERRSVELGTASGLSDDDGLVGRAPEWDWPWA